MKRKLGPDLYVDTSCLLKLFFLEPESARVAEIIEDEQRVVVSELTLLESVVQIHARKVAGLLDPTDAKRLESSLDRLIAAEPFSLVPLAPGSLATARAQVKRTRKRIPLRTLDRLHLGIMAFEGIRCLLTNDDRQAAAARALGMRVLLPRRRQARTSTKA
jgi:predicted nucleic acid-binding protein